MLKYAEEGAVIVSKDAIRYMLGAGNYIFNPDYEQGIHAVACELVDNLMYDGAEKIIIDETNMTQDERSNYLFYANERKYKRQP